MIESLRRDLSRRHVDLCLETERQRRFTNDTREAEYRLLYPPEIARHPAPWPLQVSRPFADRRLHRFLFAIPPEQKFEPHAGTDDYYAGSKKIVRRAMRGILPESIRTRITKTVFGEVWEQEISRNWSDYEAAFGPSASPEIARRGYVDQTSFWSRLTQVRHGGGGNDLVYVYALVELETWLRSICQPRSRLITVPVAGRGHRPGVEIDRATAAEVA